jgi:hypothetical protein
MNCLPLMLSAMLALPLVALATPGRGGASAEQIDPAAILHDTVGAFAGRLLILVKLVPDPRLLGLL